MTLFSSHKTDWDRGYEAGMAQQRVDSYPETRKLETEIENLKKKLKSANAKIKKLKININETNKV